MLNPVPEKSELVIYFRDGKDIEKFLSKFSKLERDKDGRFQVGNLTVTWEQNI